MIYTCGSHPKAEARVRAQQARDIEAGRPPEILYHGPRADCEWCGGRP